MFSPSSELRSMFRDAAFDSCLFLLQSTAIALKPASLAAGVIPAEPAKTSMITGVSVPPVFLKNAGT